MAQVDFHEPQRCIVYVVVLLVRKAFSFSCSSSPEEGADHF